MHLHSAVSAVHLLHQSAEAALPKQKRNMAVTEFKHAMVAHKRRHKARQEEDGTFGFRKLFHTIWRTIISMFEAEKLLKIS